MIANGYENELLIGAPNNINEITVETVKSEIDKVLSVALLKNL